MCEIRRVTLPCCRVEKWHVSRLLGVCAADSLDPRYHCEPELCLLHGATALDLPFGTCSTCRAAKGAARQAAGLPEVDPEEPVVSAAAIDRFRAQLRKAERRATVAAAAAARATRNRSSSETSGPRSSGSRVRRRASLSPRERRSGAGPGQASATITISSPVLGDAGASGKIIAQAAPASEASGHALPRLIKVSRPRAEPLERRRARKEARRLWQMREVSPQSEATRTTSATMPLAAAADGELRLTTVMGQGTAEHELPSTAMGCVQVGGEGTSLYEGLDGRLFGNDNMDAGIVDTTLPPIDDSWMAPYAATCHPAPPLGSMDWTAPVSMTPALGNLPAAMGGTGNSLNGTFSDPTTLLNALLMPGVAPSGAAALPSSTLNQPPSDTSYFSGASETVAGADAALPTLAQQHQRHQQYRQDQHLLVTHPLSESVLPPQPQSTQWHSQRDRVSDSSPDPADMPFLQYPFTDEELDLETWDMEELAAWFGVEMPQDGEMMASDAVAVPVAAAEAPALD